MMRNRYEITFDRIGTIDPEKGALGKINEFLPQSRYHNTRGLPLHKYGRGPFCRFSIRTDLRESGVYILTIDGAFKYAGECLDLSRRINAGYGNISPRACYKGGQSTNCRINNLVLLNSKEGKRINLWFHPTNNRKKVEVDLIRKVHPEWNLQLVR